MKMQKNVNNSKIPLKMGSTIKTKKSAILYTNIMTFTSMIFKEDLIKAFILMNDLSE